MKKVTVTIKHENGHIFYYKKGTNILHREDGPAFEHANGDKFWYLNGKPHRVDGPAFEYTNGAKFWYLNDKQHRNDGPAVEYANGDKEWFYQGKYIDCKTQEEFLKIISHM